MQIDVGACVVRSWRAEDEEALARHANSRKVWKDLRDLFPHPYTREDARSWIRYATRRRPEVDFAIDVEGEAVGNIGLGLHRSDIERCSAEIGYWIGEAYWGRGVATAALRALTAYAFEAFELTRLYAVPFASNAASLRVLEKAGYQREGVLRRSAIKDGVVKDQVMYARTDVGASAD